MLDEHKTLGLNPKYFDEYDYFFDNEVFTQQLVGQLKQGQMFGHLGLLLNKPRAATIVTRTDTHFAVLDKQQYVAILKQAELKKIHAQLQFF